MRADRTRLPSSGGDLVDVDSQVIVEFDDIEIDLDAFEIRRAGQAVRVEPQVFEVIRALVTRAGELVTKEELLDSVWHTRFVSEASLTSRIRDARRALGDDGRTQRVIATVHGRGYRFVAPIGPVGPTTPAAAATTSDRGRSGAAGRTQAAPALLERQGALASLEASLGDAGRGRGRVVLLGGEAGIGKTSLVRAFAEGLGRDVRQLHGSCDDLVTPRALGPFDDMSIDLPALAEVLRDPAAGDVQRLLLSELDAGGLTVMVIEDAHWADEATIDVLTSLVRRIERLPVVLILTYRDNEVIDGHPLLRTLGRVPAGIARHLRLRPLSVEAVAELVGAEQAEEVAGATGGIPFFVTEVAALDPVERSALPTSVAHAVLARVTALPDATRGLLDQISVEPSRTSAAVLDLLDPGWLDAVAPAERSGIVVTTPGWVGFRHELARRAVQEALPASRHQALHQAMADALVQLGADPDRIVHHAEAAGDHDLLVVQVIPAAERSMAASAHHQAWAHFQRLLALPDRLPPERLPELLEKASVTAYHVNELGQARQLAERSLDAYASDGDEAAVGRLHRWMSRIHWSGGSKADAHRHAERAVEVLEPLGPSEELAWAYSTRSQLAMLSWDVPATVQHGRQALALAEQLGAQAVEAHALINLAVGTDRVSGVDLDLLQRAVDLARETGQHHEVVRGLIGAAYGAMEDDRLEVAEDWAGRALAHAVDHEIDTLRAYVEAMLGRIDFLRGRWSAAEARLAGLDDDGSPVNRLATLRTRSQLAVRRGDPGTDELITQHRTLADRSGEHQRLLPAVEIEAEHAWFSGDLEAMVPALQEAVPAAATYPSHLGRLAMWLQEAGALDGGTGGLPVAVPEPYLAQLEGRWADAARRWRDLGMPFEEALALARTGGDGPARARRIAARLGASPLVDRLDAG